MVGLLFFRDFPADAPGEKGGNPVEFPKRPFSFCEVAGGCEKAFDIAPSPQIAEKILGVISGIEVPGFPFSVLMAKITHGD